LRHDLSQLTAADDTQFQTGVVEVCMQLSSMMCF
jgi:hypothetical protein